MNVETGHIYSKRDDDLDTEKTTLGDFLSKLIPINLKDATPKQRAEMRVSLKDTRSKLGQQRIAGLRQWRSRYVPHQGAKELSRST